MGAERFCGAPLSRILMHRSPDCSRSNSACQISCTPQHVERDGKLLFEEVCSRNLEGIVAKRRMGRYVYVLSA
jgi:ATP-dependent DNA ligase